MNDVIGAAGMVRGWAMLFHMYLMWLPTLVLISVALVTLIELLVSMLGLHLPLGQSHRRPGEPSWRPWGSGWAINDPGSAQPVAMTPHPELPARIQ
jgi:hypothetical protein